MTTKGIPVVSRVHRILSSLPAFHGAGTKRATEIAVQLGMPLNGDVLGFYENTANAPIDVVAVCITGIRLHLGDAWHSVPFRTIRAAQPPNVGDVRDASAIRVLLHSGEELSIPITGGTDQFRDAWEFLRFMQRVLEDQAGG